MHDESDEGRSRVRSETEPDRWDLPWQWTAGATVGRSAGYGALAGIALGAALGTIAAPFGGAVFGALFGLFIGPFFGMFDGLVLVCASGFLLRRSTWWAAIAAAIASLIAALLSVRLLGFGQIAGMWPLLIGSAAVGAACGPRTFWGKAGLKRRPDRPLPSPALWEGTA